VTNARLLWLPDVLRAAGLTVHEIAGWQDRGHADDIYYQQCGFAPQAVVFHHDGSAFGDSPGALNWLISGFNFSSDNNYDAQCWVDRYGAWYIVAAGYAQHAGAGQGWGAIPAGMGNPRSFGVETDHTDGETWPPAQLAAVRTGMAAICAHQGWDPAAAVVGHKEYAPGRKTDPDGVDMAAFRREVADVMAKGWDDSMSAADVQAVLDGVGTMLDRKLAYVEQAAAGDGNSVYPKTGQTEAKIDALTVTVGKVAGQVAALADAVTQLGGGAVDMAAVEAAAEKGAADALSHLRLTTDTPPAVGA